MTIRLRWFPPSWVQFEAGEAVVYIDPAYLSSYFKGHPGHVEFSRWPDAIDGLPEAKMAAGDLVLLTHDHKDHCKKVTVDRLCRKDTLVAGPKRCEKPLGPRLRVVTEGDEFTAAGFRVRAVPAYNTEAGRSTKKAHVRGRGVGYLLARGGITLYHAGDTDLIPEMEDLGPVDVALLPIGGTFTMDLDEAIEAALRIKPKLAIPMHHLRRADPAEFAARLNARTKRKAARALGIGEAVELG